MPFCRQNERSGWFLMANALGLKPETAPSTNGARECFVVLTRSEGRRDSQIFELLGQPALDDWMQLSLGPSGASTPSNRSQFATCSPSTTALRL